MPTIKAEGEVGYNLSAKVTTHNYYLMSGLDFAANR